VIGTLATRPRARAAASAAELCEIGDGLVRDGRHLDAMRLFRLAAAQDARCREAVVAHDHAVRALVPRWHFEMLNDAERTAAFESAIAQAVRPGDLVLDIGTGAGLLGLLSARHGAGRVVSCEGVAPVAEIAEQVVRRNGYGDRISVVGKWSTDLVVGVDLPARADVLVTEVIDCGLVGEAIVPTIRHAREHLLVEGAAIVPARATLYAQLVESVELGRLNRVHRVAGFDVSDFNRLASVEYFPIRLGQIAHRPLAEPVALFTLDFARGELDSEHTTVRAVPLVDGECHAVALWFDLELVPGVVLSNEPSNALSHWEQAVQSLERPVPVRRGEAVELRVWQRGRHLLVEHVGVRAARRNRQPRRRVEALGPR
jgi:type II protein arginine methyltransferase